MNPIDELSSAFEKKCSLQEQKSPPREFLDNIVQNSLLAYATVVPEGLAVRRIISLMQQPGATPPSYVSSMRTLGMRGLFQGWEARTSYCLLGNFANLVGQHIWEDDPRYMALLKTTVMKNCLLPFSLLSNASQNGAPFRSAVLQAKMFCFDGSKHLWFFNRNFLSNFGLWPGLEVRDRIFTQTNNQTLAQGVGFTTSCIVSGILNSFVKPGFTSGDFTPEIKWKTACKLPALGLIILRESVSIGFQLAHTKPKKID